MKRSLSLRKKIIVWMTILIIVQNILLIAGLLLSRVFFLLDTEAFRLFNNTAKAHARTLNQEISDLVVNVAREADDFSKKLEHMNLDIQRVTEQEKAYDELALLGASHLFHLLEENRISGAFFAMNPEQNEVIPSVYIRNSALFDAHARPENFSLEVGPIMLSKKYRLPASMNWNLFLPVGKSEFLQSNFYKNPLEAAGKFPREEFERYGYWTSSGFILEDKQSVIMYTMPLFDQSGRNFGVLGVEVSLPYFMQNYLYDIDMQYEDGFFAIAAVVDQKVILDDFLPGDSIAEMYLSQEEEIFLKKERDEMFSSNLKSLGEMYCSAQKLRIYSDNSPFIGQSWYLLNFVPKKVLHEGSVGVRKMMTISFVLASLCAIVAVLVLAYLATYRISGLAQYIQNLSSNQEISFKKTGLREIDDLTSAMDMLNKRAIHASKTISKILEMSLLPMGVFELSNDSGLVVFSGYIRQLLNLNETFAVSKDEWKLHYKKLTEFPAKDYENIYRYVQPGSGKVMWLRVLDSEISGGKIGLIMDVSRDIEENMRLSHELDYDPMTRLYNRNAFRRESYVKILKAPGLIGAMVFIDIDNLKYINDTFGHEMGDQLILGAAQALEGFKTAGATVSRISGDEFTIYLHGFASKDEARALIRKHLESVSSYCIQTPDGDCQRIRFSTGVAWYPEDSDSVAELLKLADFAMYEAKNKEKGSVFEFNRESYQNNIYLLNNREAINRLLDERLIHFNFQPIISLRTGEIFAYEALMRSSMPEFKSPLEILQVASMQSKMSQLERLVFCTALQSVEDQYSAMMGDTRIFINSIPDHLLSPKDFGLLKSKYGYMFHRLVLEVTEMESDQFKKVEDGLQMLRNAGIKLAIDDFGSGYSNEIRILQIKPNIVKIDMALIQGIHNNPDKQQLVRNLTSFSHERSILVVAEGVEEREDLVKLIELDVDLIQGYYTARPNPKLLPVREEVQQEILSIRASQKEQ